MRERERERESEREKRSTTLNRSDVDADREEDQDNQRRQGGGSGASRARSGLLQSRCGVGGQGQVVDLTSSDLSAGRRKRVKMFAKHELKFLNLGLVLYICLGTLLFHSLGEFEDPVGQPRAGQSNSADSLGKHPQRRRQSASLAELRSKSVQKMWNITNQLNILWESNWTELIMAELIDFERNFVDSLELRAGPEEVELDWGQEEDGDGDREESGGREEVSERGKDGDKTGSKSKWASRARIKSIKKSFVHSLATITTMGRFRLSFGRLRSRSSITLQVDPTNCSQVVSLATYLIDRDLEF